MRKVKGTGDKVNMNANMMLVGKEVDGNKITALYTLNRNGVRRRITKAEFINSARNNRIINCKANGKNLIGLEDSLRNIPAYDKKTGMLKNNITEEQVILSVNEKLVKNQLIITAKLKHNNQIIGYIVSDGKGQQKRFTRESTYKLVRQGFLNEYKARIDNGVPFIYGGNIAQLPEIKVDANGRNVEEKESAKKILEEQKKLREQHEVKLKKQQEKLKEEEREAKLKAEKEEKKHAKEEKQSMRDISEQEKKLQQKIQEEVRKQQKDEQLKQKEVNEEDKKRQEKIEQTIAVLNELGNKSEKLKNAMLEQYIDKDLRENRRVIKGLVEDRGRKIIESSEQYRISKQFLDGYADKKMGFTHFNAYEITRKIGKIDYNLLCLNGEQELMNRLIDEITVYISKMELKRARFSLNAQGELKLEDCIIKYDGRTIIISEDKLQDNIKREALYGSIDNKYLLKDHYSQDRIKFYIQDNFSFNNTKTICNENVLSKIQNFIEDREESSLKVKSLNNFIQVLIEKVDSRLSEEFDVIKQVLAATLIDWDEIAYASKTLEGESFDNIDWDDRYSQCYTDIHARMSYSAYDGNVLDNWKTRVLDNCIVLNINNTLMLVPETISVRDFASVLIIYMQMVEQSSCYVHLTYYNRMAGHTQEWLTYGSDSESLKESILSASDNNELEHILNQHGVDTRVLNDIKDIKEVLRNTLDSEVSVRGSGHIDREILDSDNSNGDLNNCIADEEHEKTIEEIEEEIRAFSEFFENI